MGYNEPTQRSTGTFITASIYNTDLVDNISYLFAPGSVSKSGAYTSGLTDRTIICTAAMTLTLLAVATASGRDLRVINDSSGTVTIDGNGAETINAQATVTVGAGGMVDLYCDGTEWFMR